MTILCETWTVLQRLGKAPGWEDCYAGGKLEIGRVIDRLIVEAAKASILPAFEEPEYLRIAREAGLRPVAHSGSQ